VVGPLAENIVKGQAARYTTNPELQKWMNVFNEQKGKMITLSRAQGEIGQKALAAVSPEMDVLSPTSGYPAVQQVLNNFEKEFRAGLAGSQTPGAWDYKPNAIPASAAEARKPPITRRALDNAVARGAKREDILSQYNLVD
jgi:hypothetical protein